jgi:hypothetical protein
MMRFNPYRKNIAFDKRGCDYVYKELSRQNKHPPAITLQRVETYK